MRIVEYLTPHLTVLRMKTKKNTEVIDNNKRIYILENCVGLIL